MSGMPPSFLSRHFDEQLRLLPTMAKWLLLALAVGLLSGSASAFFLFALDRATGTRVAHRWLIALLPLLSIVSFMSFDLAGYMRDSMSASMSGSTATMELFSPSYLWMVAGGWGIYLVTALLAYFDWRKLGRDGYARPFHWAWAFLTGTVYVIGRSVVVRRRSGRGLLPIWVLIAVFVLSCVVSIVQVVGAMSAMFATMPSFS